MNLDQPKKHCPKCGSLIPANDEYGPYGLVSKPKLACEACARDAMPPKPKVKKLRPGERHPDQPELDEGPGIKID